MPAPARQTGRCGTGPASGSRSARTAARKRTPARPQTASKKSLHANSASAMTTKKTTRLDRKHQQKNDEINSQRPLVTDVAAGEASRHAQHKTAQSHNLNGTHAAQHNNDE